jgi:hypothetical protein
LDVTAVQEGGPIEAHIDESTLHAGQHANDFALVDASDDAAFLVPLYVKLGNLTPFDERDACLEGSAIDDELF